MEGVPNTLFRNRTVIGSQSRNIRICLMIPRKANGLAGSILGQTHCSEHIARSMASGITGRAVGEGLMILNSQEYSFCIYTVEADIQSRGKAVLLISIDGVV